MKPNNWVVFGIALVFLVAILLLFQSRNWTFNDNGYGKQLGGDCPERFLMRNSTGKNITDSLTALSALKEVVRDQPWIFSDDTVSDINAASSTSFNFRTIEALTNDGLTSFPTSAWVIGDIAITQEGKIYSKRYCV